MPYTLLAGGYRESIALLTFDPATAKLKVESESPVPSNPSWIEKSLTQRGVFYSLSEEEEEPLATSLKLVDDKVVVTRQRKAGAGATHVHCMKDGSGIVIANYVGGSIVFFPFESDGSLSSSSESPLLKFPYLYPDGAPNPKRQEAPHAHQVIEGRQGELYVPDLGNDRVWIVNRTGPSGLTIKGWLQAPAGSGPRHAVISSDLKYLYLLAEMGHAVYCFPIDGSATVVDEDHPIFPLPGFKAQVHPDSAPQEYSAEMDAAEIVWNPVIPRVLYASNRAELRMKEHNVGKEGLPDPPVGDAIVIILLGEDGTAVESVKHVRTTCDTLRALQISPDGKYAATAGQVAGGVEIWRIEGERGDQWKLAAKLEQIEKVTDFVWL